MERIPARAANKAPAASNATKRMIIGPTLISGEIILPLPESHHYCFFHKILILFYDLCITRQVFVVK
jgi:hypothetical protein